MLIEWFGSQSAMDYCLENNIKFLLAMPKNRPTEMWKKMRELALRNGHTMMWKKNEISVRAISMKVNQKVFHFC